MRSATRITVSTFGALAGLMGIEHGIGAALQGNVPPAGMMIASWPGSELFQILAGEPAMTLVPNLLVSGILAILVSVAFLVWVTAFVQRRAGGLVLLLLSVAMLLVGGGFGPPLLGILLSLPATRINAPLARRRSRPADGVHRLAGRVWRWSFGACVIAWLALFPGSILLDRFVGVRNRELVIGVLFCAAFGSLLFTIAAALLYDSQSRATAGPPPAPLSARPVAPAGS